MWSWDGAGSGERERVLRWPFGSQRFSAGIDGLPGEGDAGSGRAPGEDVLPWTLAPAFSFYLHSLFSSLGMPQCKGQGCGALLWFRLCQHPSYWRSCTSPSSFSSPQPPSHPCPLFSPFLPSTRSSIQQVFPGHPGAGQCWMRVGSLGEEIPAPC